MEKVTVTSKINATVGISIPELRLKKEWKRKGATTQIEMDVLKEALFDPGVEYMFTTGILYIEDMKAKIELGLEPEDAKVPQNIIILSDEEIEELMSSKKQAWELKKVLETLTYEGKRAFCEYIVEKELVDAKKSVVIKEVCNFDALRAIQNKQANEASVD